MIASITPARGIAENDVDPRNRFQIHDALASQFGCLGEIENLMHAHVASWSVSRGPLEFRSCQRVPFDQPIQLTPLNDETWEPVESPMTVTGSNISLGGISFRHSDLLPYRTVAIQFGSEERGPHATVVRLKWCRFGTDHSFVSGGTFVGTVDRNDESGGDRLSTNRES